MGKGGETTDLSEVGALLLELLHQLVEALPLAVHVHHQGWNTSLIEDGPRLGRRLFLALLLGGLAVSS